MQDFLVSLTPQSTLNFKPYHLHILFVLYTYVQRFKHKQT